MENKMQRLITFGFYEKKKRGIMDKGTEEKELDNFMFIFKHEDITLTAQIMKRWQCASVGRSDYYEQKSVKCSPNTVKSHTQRFKIQLRLHEDTSTTFISKQSLLILGKYGKSISQKSNRPSFLIRKEQQDEYEKNLK